MTCLKQIAAALGVVALGGFAQADDLQNAPDGVRASKHQEARATVATRTDANGLTQVMEAGGGLNVLHYEEFTLGISAYTEALITIGATVTFTADPFVFESELQTGSYDAVISAHQNTFALSVYEDDLVAWAAANPNSPVLISDWRVNNPDVYGYLAAIGGFSYTGTTNPVNISPVAGGVFDGLAGDALVSPGWGIYAYNTAGGTTEAVASGQGGVARTGTAFFNGFLSDVFGDVGIGMRYVMRELSYTGCPDCQGLVPGNRVRLIVDSDNPSLLAGNGGTVLGYNPSFPGQIATRWDNFHDGHCYGVGFCGGGASVLCPIPDSVGDASGWWVPCEQVRIDYDCPGDANHDGVIDISDLLITLGAWGGSCP
jgi:hypothetical protein